MNYLYGAGGHSLVILDMCRLSGIRIDALIDDSPRAAVIEGIPCYSSANLEIESEDRVIISIGNNNIRKSLSKKLTSSFFSVIHPAATVAPTAVIGLGTVVMAGAIINASAVIGDHVILNTSCVVDHETVIGDFVHISPGAILCGHLEVGEGTQIGAGATLLPGVKVGKYCMVGAGAVITQDVPDQSMVVGVPGKVIRKLEVF